MLQTDLAGETALSTAHVVRTDPTKVCDYGLCPNGPQAAWGYTYYLTLTSTNTSVEPTSPTRPASPAFNGSGSFAPAVIASNNVTCSVGSASGAVCGVSIVNGHAQDAATRMPLQYAGTPVTLPFGGAGGSHGGVGGLGHARQTPHPVVLDDVVSDLVAGSGGAVGGEIVQVGGCLGCAVTTVCHHPPIVAVA